MPSRRFPHLPLVASILAVAILTPGSFAQETKTTLPSVEEVLNAYVDAIGDKETMAKQKSRKISGTMSIPAMQMSGPMIIYAAEPNFFRVDITIPGMGKNLQGYNGKIGWQIDVSRGPLLMKGDVLEQFMREADFHAEENILKYYDEAKVIGEVEFNGQPCFELSFKKGDRDESRYYNRTTHLLAGSKGVYPTELGDIPVRTVISNYKVFHGMKVATRTAMEMVSMGIEQVLEITAVSINDIDPSVFDLPPAIQALADAAAAEEKAQKPAEPKGE